MKHLFETLLLPLCLHTWTTNAFSSTLLSEKAPKLQPTVTPVTLLQRPCPVHNGWEQLVPSTNLLQPFQKQSGCDVTIEWKNGEDLNQVAASLLQKTPAKEHVHVLEEYLADCLQDFQSFCSQHLRVQTDHPNSIQGFKARIVATRGATKCPRWHLDHVPVRWIQSLVGPGCDYVVDQDYSEELQEFLNDDNRQNSAIETRQAKPQEVALLVGNRWNEFALEAEPYIPPVLHKSPEIPVWNGRVLFTLDVVVPYHNDDD